MKKLIFYFLFFYFFKLYSSLAWGYEVNFKSKITCDLFLDGKKFTTKTWPLDTDNDGGYLNWVTDTIIEWHESIVISENPLKWRAMFYHVDRYSGEGSWKGTAELDNEFYLKNFLNKNSNKRNADLLLKNSMEFSGDISCREENKKF